MKLYRSYTGFFIIMSQLILFEAKRIEELSYGSQRYFNSIIDGIKNAETADELKELHHKVSSLKVLEVDEILEKCSQAELDDQEMTFSKLLAQTPLEENGDRTKGFDLDLENLVQNIKPTIIRNPEERKELWKHILLSSDDPMVIKLKELTKHMGISNEELPEFIANLCRKLAL